ncbi:gp16 family protein [Neisseria sp. Ec49-e6-T10]|uniref:gp16 family protein n=1 Tax=Neisseria sp. Ec49-e6-T10 TaxID=3140744 RepID=UPI003EBFDECA
MSTNFIRAKIAKIHIAKQQLCMVDDDYRALLIRITGKRSSTQLSDTQLNDVLRELERLGFQPKKRDITAPPNPKTDIAPMIAKIEALLAHSNLPWTYAHAMAERMFNIKRVQWLNPRQIHKLVAALQMSANRKG